MSFEIRTPILKEASEALSAIFANAKAGNLNMDAARIVIDAAEQQRCAVRTDLQVRLAAEKLHEIEAQLVVGHRRDALAAPSRPSDECGND